MARTEAPPALARPLAGPLVVGALVAVGTLALRLRDPHRSGSWGYCPWKLLTGLDCPGCGTLRAVNDLTHGHVVAAASSNLLFVLMVPVVAGAWLAWARRRWLGTPAPVRSRRATRATWTAAVVVTVAFTVLRNVPAGSWLHS